MKLRAYQADACRRVWEHWNNGRRGVLVVLPTGGGKTCTAMEIVCRELERGGRVAWFAHRRELVGQAKDTLRHAGLGAALGRTVEVVTVQSVLAREVSPDATLCVLDEARHYAAEDWRRAHEAYPETTRILGLDATPEREDGRGLGDIFDEIVIGATVEDLVKLWQEDPTTGLVPTKVWAPAKEVPKGAIAMWPHEAYVRLCPTSRALVFCPNVAAADEYARVFGEDTRLIGVRCAVVHGGTPPDTRAERLRLFELGLVSVLFNVYVLTEGYDCPPCDAVIIARRVSSASAWGQMAGRAMRPFPGKTGCQLIDLGGDSAQHGHPAEPKTYALHGPGIRRLMQPNDGPRFCRCCSALLLLGATSCTECGREAPVFIPRDAKLRMREMAREEMRRMNPDGRARWLASVARNQEAKARAAGRRYNPKQAAVMYHVKFGLWPSRETLIAAGLPVKE